MECTMKQYETFELSFKAPAPSGSSAVVDLQATFTTEGECRTVTGFYAGDGVYKVRFYPTKAGRYDWKVFGVIDQEGSATCTQNDNPKAGIVHGKDTHFEYEAGAAFIPFGTTVYALMHQEDALIDRTMSTLKASPFNKVRLCLFPKRYDFNNNEPKYFAFERNADGRLDVNRPCYKFWDAFEARLQELFAMGIQVDLILFHPYDDVEHWGHSAMSHSDDLIYLDYLIRRFAAFPNIWWSLANEYDLMYHKSIDDWHGIEEFVASHDPYHHLLSIHQAMVDYDYSRDNISHLSMQTKYIANTGNYIRQFGKPVVYDEVCYEGNLQHRWGNLTGFEMTNRFWMAVASGAYCTHGEVILPATYDKDNEILWWAKGGELHGESPRRIAFLRSIIDALPGPVEYMDEVTKRPISSMDEISRLPAELQKKFKALGALHFARTEQKRVVDQVFDTDSFGHIGDDVFIAYFGHHANGTYCWLLPEAHHYKVELVDVWNMTRDVVVEDASGSTEVPMRGTVGQALIATKIS